MKVVVIGGGWSGVAAAIEAKKMGADVVLFEKTDLLLGLGNVGGIMRNNGRFTASEELIALGAGDLINITDKNSRHKNIEFPGHKHASLYDVNIIEAEVRKHLNSLGIKIFTETTSKIVKNGMREVVLNGTGQSANVNGIEIGGKTGSATTSNKTTHGWFVGYFKVKNKEYTMIVFIPDLVSKKNESLGGGNTAAPIFKDIVLELNK
ncbi:MAG: FAD-dependent oxidoreductase [Clostridium baratii]|nr:FAD-dependent oxidoreductase [Clostridium baratii]